MLKAPDINPALSGTGNLERFRGRSDAEATRAAAREMESLFLYEMLQAMRRTTEMSKEGGMGMGSYTTMFDLELSKVLAERGIGIKEMMLRALDRAGASEQDNSAPAAPGTGSRSSAPVTAGPVISGNGRVTSQFGMRSDPFTGEQRFHAGIDIASAAGDAVRPVQPGRVVFSGEQEGYGNTVIVDHGGGLATLYAHNQENLVKEGDQVDSRTVIALVGSTGRATGPHLHFEVRYNGAAVDPRPYLG